MVFKTLLMVAVVFVSCEKRVEIEPVERYITHYFDTSSFLYVRDTAMDFYCSDSLVIPNVPTQDYCYFLEDGQIVYVDSENDTIFHYDIKKQLWIKRKVTTTIANMMIFNLIAGNKNIR